jgi:hypothetical protein
MGKVIVWLIWFAAFGRSSYLLWQVQVGYLLTIGMVVLVLFIVFILEFMTSLN